MIARRDDVEAVGVDRFRGFFRGKFFEVRVYLLFIHN